MNPRIGVTCSTTASTDRYYVPRHYVEGIDATGGIPLLLSPLKSEDKLDTYLSLVDGLLLSGGADLDPVFYNQEPKSGMRRIDPEKDRLELKLGKSALERGIPILGICRGCQMLNVIGGGTLNQHIDGLKHWQNAPEAYPTHEIEIRRGTKLFQILQTERIRVNTFHHQSVKDVASGFVVSATSKDGVIEGLESTTHPFAVGVQFHLEYLWKEDPAFKRIFSAFVEASKSRGLPSQDSSSPGSELRTPTS